MSASGPPSFGAGRHTLPWQGFASLTCGRVRPLAWCWRPETQRHRLKGRCRLARVRKATRPRAPGGGRGFSISREDPMTQVQTKNRATSDEAARKDVLKRIDDEGVEFVLLWFTDIEGHLKSFAVTPGEVEAALDDGMGFDGSSITGFNAIEESDMVAIPDPSTFRIMPR